MVQKTILVTGATGFIGSQLLHALLDTGFKVCIIKRKESGTWRIAEALTHQNIKVYGDEVGEIKRAFSEQIIDCVVHLAAKYIKQHSQADDVRDLITSNVVFPSTLLEVMREFNVRSIVTTGTFFEYDLQGNNKLTETSPLKPYNLYARTKLLFDDVARDYVTTYGFSCVHLRLFAPYGPKDNEKLMHYLIRNLLSGQAIKLTPAEQQWNFTYVDDIVAAYVQAINFCLKMKGGHEVFNIGNTEAVSIKTVVGIIEKKLAVSGLVSYDKPYQQNEIFYAVCDGLKAKEQLGWTAATSISDGLEKTINYYRT